MSDRSAIAIFLALVVAAAVYHFGWGTAATHAQGSKVISGQIYSRVNVPLDGVEYVDCTFDNVTFVYEGKGQIKLTRATIEGNTHWDSHNPGVRVAMRMVAELYNERDAALYNKRPHPTPAATSAYQ